MVGSLEGSSKRNLGREVALCFYYTGSKAEQGQFGHRPAFEFQLANF
jgi:hypothetical protein